MLARFARLLVVLAVMLTGCGTAVSTPSPAAQSSAAQSFPATASLPATPAATPIPTFARNPAPIVEGQPYVQHIDPAMFVDRIDNPFMPWIVGSRFVFDGTEHVEVTVLPDTKEILGVQTTTVHDQVFSGSEVTEDTLDWYAQDAQGNVWYFGEQTAEYEGGKVTSTEGSWVGGVDGAQPGIIMLAQPAVGDSYRQEYACVDLSPIHRGHNKHTTYFPGQARSNLPAVYVNTNRRRQYETHSHQTSQMAHRSGRGSLAHRDAQLRLIRHRGYCL